MTRDTKPFLLFCCFYLIIYVFVARCAGGYPLKLPAGDSRRNKALEPIGSRDAPNVWHQERLYAVCGVVFVLVFIIHVMGIL